MVVYLGGEIGTEPVLVIVRCENVKTMTTKTIVTRMRVGLFVALSLLQVSGAFAAMVIPPVTFDLDTVGSQSGNPSLIHSSMVDWQVATDSILDPVPAENVYQSTNDQTNLKVVFPSVTLAVGESLRVKVDSLFGSAQ